MALPNRVILIVMDSVGVGELPDAEAYGDRGSDTLGNISRLVPLQLPSLRSLGLPSSRAPEGPGREVWTYEKAGVAYLVEGPKVIETRTLPGGAKSAAVPPGKDEPAPAVRVDARTAGPAGGGEVADARGQRGKSRHRPAPPGGGWPDPPSVCPAGPVRPVFARYMATSAAYSRVFGRAPGTAMA